MRQNAQRGRAKWQPKSKQAPFELRGAEVNDDEEPNILITRYGQHDLVPYEQLMLCEDVINGKEISYKERAEWIMRRANGSVTK